MRVGKSPISFETSGAIESAGDFLTGGPGTGTGGAAFRPESEQENFKGENENDFSFLGKNLETKPDPRNPLPGESLEEFDARMDKLKEEADKEEPEEDTELKAKAEAEAKAKADAESKAKDKPAEDKKPDAEEWTADKITAEKAKAWDSFNATLEKKPEDLAEFVLSKMTPAEQRAVLQKIAPSLLDKDAPAPFDAETYEHTSDMEEALKHRWGNIERIPDVIKQVEALQKQIGESGEQTVRRLDVPVTQANIRVEMALAKLEALTEAFEIDLPDIDLNAVIKILSEDHRKTFRSAVREAVGSSYKDSVTLHKQRNVKRPETPANGSKHEEGLRQGMDLSDIIRLERRRTG